MSLDQAFSTIGDEIRSLEYTLDKLYSLKSFGEMNVNGKVHKVSTGISISKELEVMVKKEISDIIGKIDNFKKILENLEKDKEVKKELNKFSNLEAIDYANNYGYYLNIIYINESTSEAWLLDVEELDEIWIPKSQCKINGNLLFIKKWWFETKKNTQEESQYI